METRISHSTLLQLKWCHLSIAIVTIVGLNSAYGEIFGGIDFPSGVSSFADNVIRYDPLYSGGPAPIPAYRNPDESLGPPDFAGVEGFVTLGRGGLIELEFTDNLLTNSGGPELDLHIFEIGIDVEDTFVAIRPTTETALLLGSGFDSNGDGFYEVGKVLGATSSIDIDGFFPPFPPGVLLFDAVQLIDDPDEGLPTGDDVGADIDSVGAIQSQAVDCYPDLPDPELILADAEDDTEYTMYTLGVFNWSEFPDVLFEPAPDLPPCGENPNASRTWVEIYQEDGTYIYGHCGLEKAEDLTDIRFNYPRGLSPGCVYITLYDRRCDEVYISNLVCISFDVDIDIDIKPGSCPNPLNVKSKGVLPVAVLGTEVLDVTDIDVATVSLAGVAPIRFDYEDVATPFEGELCDCHGDGPDGYLDLTLKFDTQEIVTALGDVEDGEYLPLTLSVTLIDGTVKEGADCIRIIKKGKD